MYIPVHLLAASFCCAKTSLLLGTTAIRGGKKRVTIKSLCMNKYSSLIIQRSSFNLGYR